MKSHGLSNTPTYRSWVALKNRSFNPNTKDYAKYGAVNITACKGTANSFQHFMSVVGVRPEKMTIDRIKNQYGYWCGVCEECRDLNRPLNMRWATDSLQKVNRRILKNNISGVTGVALNKKSGLWVANICRNGQKRYLGFHKNLDDAIAARLNAEKDFEV